ncbi:TetR/AcrR family transcriptional regulator [Rhodococcus sp. NPDC076796]|uniref:TetR/AcrR family transcriptional regulator n=1 Tax=Rhodococcus sp. NPDC076796 TaxID=3154859 RepID=UPI00344F215A
MPNRVTKPAARAVRAAARAAETRQRLIDAAVALFSEADYDKVGVADIVESADVAHGLLFHYFGNKRGIYLESMRATASAMSQAFADIPDSTPDVQIRAALTSHLEYLSVHRGLALRMVLGGRGADPEAWEVFEGARTAVLEAAATRLGLDAGNTGVRLVGRSIVAAIDGATARWLEEDVSIDVEQMVEWLVHLIVACLRTAPVLDSSLNIDDAVASLRGSDQASGG